MGRMHTYTFPRAAVTKYHKLGGLKQQYLSSLSSGGQKFKNQGVRRTKLALNPIKEKPSLSPPASDGGRQSLASWCAAGSLWSLTVITGQCLYVSLSLCPLISPCFQIRTCILCRHQELGHQCIFWGTQFNPQKGSSAWNAPPPRLHFSLSFFWSLLRCHFLSEDFLSHLIEMATSISQHFLIPFPAFISSLSFVMSILYAVFHVIILCIVCLSW